jgi:phosphate transport system permease protein
MSTTPLKPEPVSDPPKTDPVPAPGPRHRTRSSLLAHGQPMVWLHGGALVICLCMIVGLLLLVLYQGLPTFWPGEVVQVRLIDGKVYMGEVIRTETYQVPDNALQLVPVEKKMGLAVSAVSLASSPTNGWLVGVTAETLLAAEKKDEIKAILERSNGKAQRRLYRTDNFELTQVHHHLIGDWAVTEETRPEWAVVIERLNNDGRFYGFPRAFLIDGKEVADDPAGSWVEFHAHHDEVLKRLAQREKIEKRDIGAVNARQFAAQLNVRQAELSHGQDSQAYTDALEKQSEVKEWAAREHAELNGQIVALNKDNNRFKLVLTTASGETKVLNLVDICRAYPANQLSFWGKLSVYFARWWEFLSAEPRHANSEGGVFPAIWGTVAMTLLMTVAVVPFGVMAALYLREYAKAGPIISLVRISINNLAGVPSIVFGVFGLGFFCYIVGVRVDQLLFQAYPAHQFGKEGLLWASLTMALLTLPVVIVATEEAVAAVPRSMREGSYACGASKWQTIWRIVLPRAMPGILTGMILAVARGAGEVAPLMLVGATKFAPALPVDDVFPFLHPQRQFMHLGYHIFDLGYHSPDSESAKPMVYTTTLLLIVLIATLNLGAMWIRGRLRKRYMGGQF